MSNPSEPRKKVRRTEEQLNSVPLLSSLPLTNALGNILESGHLADVVFLVGDEDCRREIPAHKCILSARSEVFMTMVEERWNALKPGETVARIEIDSGVNPNAFEQIIRFIYKDDATSCLKTLSFEDLFDIRLLAGMYGFSKLQEAASMKIALDIVQDYSKCFHTLEQNLEDKHLMRVAIGVLRCNLEHALAAEELPIKWTKQIWEAVLKDDSLNLEEILLFKCLWRWRNHEPSAREETFQKLLQLIRFPLMGVSNLFTDVRPTGALAIDVLLDILQNQQDTTTPAAQRPELPFSAEKRSKKSVWVKNSDELNRHLAFMPEIEDIADFITIFLLPGEYTGVIDVNKGFVKLIGFGPYTVLRGRESVLRISSDQTAVSSITLQGTMTVLNVTGNFNVVGNVTSSRRNSMFALVVTGDGNQFRNFSDSPSDLGLESDFQSDMKDFVGLCRREGKGTTFLSSWTPIPRFILCDGPLNKFSSFVCNYLSQNRNGSGSVTM